MTKMTRMEGWTTKKKRKECLAGTREEYSVWRKKMKMKMMKMKRGRGWMKSQAGPVVRG